MSRGKAWSGKRRSRSTDTRRTKSTTTRTKTRGIIFKELLTFRPVSGKINGYGRKVPGFLEYQMGQLRPAQQARPLRTGKFVDDEVRRIREAYSDDPTNFNVKECALFYGVSPETIRKILRRDTYWWVPDIAPNVSASPFSTGSYSRPVEQASTDKIAASLADVQKRLAGGITNRPIGFAAETKEALEKNLWVAEILGQIEQAPPGVPGEAAAALGGLIVEPPSDEKLSPDEDPYEK